MKMPLKRISQRYLEQGDCGLASVAMIAGVPYEKSLGAFRKIKGKELTENFYTSHRQIEKMLKHLSGTSRRKLRKETRFFL
jgi:hypothetical protein